MPQPPIAAHGEATGTEAEPDAACTHIRLTPRACLDARTAARCVLWSPWLRTADEWQAVERFFSSRDATTTVAGSGATVSPPRTVSPWS